MKVDQLNEFLLSAASFDWAMEMRPLVEGCSDLLSDYALDQTRTACRAQSNIESRLRLAFLLDFLESCRAIRIERAVNEHRATAALLEQIEPTLLPILNSLHRKIKEAGPEKLSGYISSILNAVQDELSKERASTERASILELTRQFLQVSDRDLLPFITEHKPQLSPEPLAWLGLATLLAYALESKDIIARRRQLLRDYQEKGAIEALGNYHGLTFVAEGQGGPDDFMDTIEEIYNGGKLITNELSHYVTSLARERLIRRALNGEDLDASNNEEDCLRVLARLGDRLERQRAIVLASFLENFAQCTGDILRETSTRHGVDPSRILDSVPPSLKESPPHCVAASLVWNTLADSWIRKVPEAPNDVESSKEVTSSVLDLNFAKPVPTVDLSRVVDDPDTGQRALDIRHLRIPVFDGTLALPMIVDFAISKLYKIGSYQTLVVKNCSSIGIVVYEHIMYIYREIETTPCLVVAAETNTYLQKEACSLSPPGYEAVLPLYFGVFTHKGHSNFGLSAEIREGDKFIERAHAYVKKSFDLSDDPLPIDIDAQIALINSPLDVAHDHMRLGRHSDALLILLPLVDQLRCSAYRSPLSRTLLYLTWCHTELGQISQARECASEGLALESSRENSNSVAVFLSELSKLDYIEDLIESAQERCQEALSIKLQSPTLVIQGFVTFSHPYNEDINGELFLLAIILRERGEIEKLISLLQILRSRCEQSYNSQLLAATLDELGIAFFETNDFVRGVDCFNDALLTKSALGDLRGVLDTLTILTVCCLKKPEADTDEIAFHIKSIWT